MPVLLPVTPPEVVERIAEAVEDPHRYGAPFPLPTVSMSEPAFSPCPVEARLVWRGTVWINTNWYVARGLRRHGRPDLAHRIEEASVALVERAGLREHFDPLSGEGHGARGFGWTALVLDMMAGW
jgi:glycogen debranching enzyme